MQPVLQLLKCHSAGIPSWCWPGGAELLCPLLPGETGRGHGRGMERGQKLCHQPAAQQVSPLSFPGLSAFPQSFHFLRLFEDEGLLLLSGFLLYLLSQSSLIWWLWERLPCFCNLDVAETLLSIELSMIPAHKAQIYFTRAAEASL